MVLLVFWTLAGCNRLGPAAMQAERFNYNVSVQRTNDEQLLLNLVRLKYRDTPFFLEVSSVASQLSAGANANASASLARNMADVFGLGLGANYQERPTITYSPLQGDKFIQRVLAPVTLETLSLLYHSGWRVDRLFLMCLQRLQNLKNAPRAASPTPSNVPVYREFADAARLLESLQERDVLEVALDNHPPAPRLIIGISENAADWPEVAQLSRALGFDSPRTRFVLSTGNASNDPGYVRIVTRSLLGIMFYLSQAVEAPLRDQEQGKVTLTKYPSGEIFDWSQVTGGLLRIQSQDSAPDTASVSVNYR
ncbi:MAG: hypothetical protein ACE5GQ_12085, partial [Nitrospinales bacterium]